MQFAPRNWDGILIDKNLLPHWEQILFCKINILNKWSEVEQIICACPFHSIPSFTLCQNFIRVNTNIIVPDQIYSVCQKLTVSMLQIRITGIIKGYLSKLLHKTYVVSHNHSLELSLRDCCSQHVLLRNKKIYLGSILKKKKKNYLEL